MFRTDGGRSPVKSYVAPLAVSLIPADEVTRPVSSVIVTHADLDLDSCTGKAEFQDRIATAVDDLCGQHPHEDASSMILIQRCRDGARDLATANVAQAIAAAHINPTSAQA
jgi:UrcA family protein